VSALATMFGAAPLQSALLYVSLGLLAPVVAVLYVTEGPWGLVACLVPLALARATLLDAERLQHARKRLTLKDQALREATEQVAEERRDERMVLAGELHDTVLPALFKVHLMGQVIRQDLASGRLLELDNDIPELIQATTVAQSSVRRIVSNLRRSPIGPGGLLPSIEALTRQLEVSGAAPFSVELSEVGGSDRAQLVIYQVAREAMTNAARYARADLIRVELWSDDGLIRLLVSDDGRGFEVDRPRPADHFGLELMRERVEAVGGSLVVNSRLGQGTAVSVAVPPDA
jgi:signal transduction histidine kinase